MQDVENDMDDLFLRAATNFKVKPGASYWNEISAQLTSLKTPGTAATKNNNGKKYAVAAVLFVAFILTGVIITDYAGLNKTAVVKNSSQQNNKYKTGKDFIEKENVQPIFADKKVNKNSLLLPGNDAFKNQPLALSGTYNLQKNIAFNDGVKNYLPGAQNKEDTTNAKQQNELGKQQLNDTNTIKTSTAKIIKPLSKPTGFYIGVVSGVQFNKVKNQALQKAGFDVGIQAGYAFNSKLSLESGLIFSKKYYTSSGKYFKMSKMPSNMQVLSLQGCSSVLQVPLKIKYHVLNKNANSGFISAGISSYLLAQEKNNYHAVINGTPQNIIRTYKNSSAYAAATMDISAGYQHAFKNNTTLTIEPFIQIPLKGIGVGTMPVTTAGVHFGLSLFPHH